MPQSHEEKARKKDPVADVGPKPPRGDKTKLKGATFAEGEAMLKPGGQADGKGVPKAMGGKGASGPDVGAGKEGNDSTEEAAPREYHDPRTTKVIENDGSWVFSVVPNRDWVYALNDPSTDRFKVLTRLELAAIVLYTDSGHFDVMNEILRGQPHDHATIAKYQPVIDAVTSGLKKLKDPAPEELRNEFKILAAAPAPATQGGGKKRGMLGRFVHGHTKEGKREKRLARRAKNGRAPHSATPGPRGDTSKVSRVFRRTKMSEGFAPVFGGLTVGQTYTEKGFLSTTSVEPRGNFGGIVWQIWDPTGGKAIDALSVTDAEMEVLFPPGVQMDIESLHATSKDNANESEYVSNPRQRWPSNDPKSPDSFRSKMWKVEARIKPPSGTEAEEDESEEEVIDASKPKDPEADKTKRM